MREKLFYEGKGKVDGRGELEVIGHPFFMDLSSPFFITFVSTEIEAEVVS